MSKPIQITSIEPRANGAAVSTGQHYIAKINGYFAGTVELDAQQAAEELALLNAPIALREYEIAQAERRQLRTKRPTQESTAGALHALRKLLASGGG